jgi:myo-inositol-1(or 4)-monophosphatase
VVLPAEDGHRRLVVAAVIHLPFIGTQYTALLGHGAFADDRQLHVSNTSTLADALISIDHYAFGEDAARKNRWRLRLTERLAHDAQRVRMLGSSAIDLAWTAEGRLDACIMLGNKPWDTSAGVLIAREAGPGSWTTTAPSTPNSRDPQSRSPQRWRPT